MRAVIATGEGRYADQWHPFAATSLRVKSVLEDAGFTVAVDEDLDGTMTRLDGVDLLVVNAANREGDFEWMKDREHRGSDVRDVSDEYALLAVQGPRSLERLGFEVDWAERHTFPGHQRCHTRDGHGNRVELLA